MISGDGNAIEKAIETALATWREDADASAVRRALVAALAALESTGRDEGA